MTTGMILELDRVQLCYSGIRVIDKLSLAVRPAEILALTRPLGCDKTTVLRGLAGLGELGCSDEDLAAVELALRAPAWQVREGAARKCGAQPDPAGGFRSRGAGCAGRGARR